MVLQGKFLVSFGYDLFIGVGSETEDCESFRVYVLVHSDQARWDLEENKDSDLGEQGFTRLVARMIGIVEVGGQSLSFTMSGRVARTCWMVKGQADKSKTLF